MSLAIDGAPTDSIGRTMARIRATAALGFATVAIAYRPAESGRGVPAGWCVFIAAMLVATNFLPVLGRRDLARNAFVTMLQIAIDTLLIIVALRAFGVGLSSAANFALVVPIIEAAVRFRVRGALLCWAFATGLLFLSIVGSAETLTPDLLSELGSTAAVLLFLSLPIAYTTEHLMNDLRAAAHARFVAERRAEMLGVLALAGRDVNALSRDQVFRSISHAASRLGGLATDGQLWDGLSWRPIDIHKRDPHQANHVLLRRLKEPADDWEDGVSVAETDGWSVITLRLHFEHHHLMLRVVTEERWSVMVHEALEVLASLAGVALKNTELHDRMTKLTNELTHRSEHDALTGLGNRRLLAAALDEAAAEPGREGVALLYIDLDGFKEINDRLGHQAGDELLRSIAERLRSAAGPTALTARLGGDEFAVLVQTPDPYERSEEIAARITERLTETVVVEGNEVSVGASVGCSIVSPDELLDPEALIKDADKRMYAAKLERKAVPTSLG